MSYFIEWFCFIHIIFFSFSLSLLLWSLRYWRCWHRPRIAVSWKLKQYNICWFGLFFGDFYKFMIWHFDLIWAVSSPDRVSPKQVARWLAPAMDQNQWIVNSSSIHLHWYRRLRRVHVNVAAVPIIKIMSILKSRTMSNMTPNQCSIPHQIRQHHVHTTIQKLAQAHAKFSHIIPKLWRWAPVICHRNWRMCRSQAIYCRAQERKLQQR